jgi:hypothetical protein
MRLTVGTHYAGQTSWWLNGHNNSVVAWAGRTFDSVTDARQAADDFKTWSATAEFEVYEGARGSCDRVHTIAHPCGLVLAALLVALALDLPPQLRPGRRSRLLGSGLRRGLLGGCLRRLRGAAFAGAPVALAPRIPTDQRFSRIYRGRKELIDHIFVSHALAGKITKTTLPGLDPARHGDHGQPVR